MSTICPLYKRLKNNGTSVYALPGAAEDINASNQNSEYKIYFSKYVLLNFPKQNLILGTNSSPIYFDFDNSFEKSPDSNPPPDYKDALIESIRNYIANFEITMKGSKINNNEYYYDHTDLNTPSEKIFWKWCHRLNLISLEPANKGDEYFDNLIEFESNEPNDITYFPEILWRERKVEEFEIWDYYGSSNPLFIDNLEIEMKNPTNFRVGDKINIYDETNTDVIGNTSKILDGSSATASVNGLNLNIVFKTEATYNTKEKIIIGTYSAPNLSSGGQYTGKAELVYHKLVQYIGEINGVNNVQEANRSYVEIFAHVPQHTGMTPDILFRTKADNNYKPNGIFPILPSEIQPEIVGAEIFTNPIVSTPQNYPGGYWGQFDTEYYEYETSTGDLLRRSGEYYGIDGDIDNPVVIPDNIDGISLDFDSDHYVKMNIIGREVSNFDQFNAMEINNNPPEDFEFNVILWYYDSEDSDGNIATNLYGISILDNPDNNPIPSETGLRIPVYKKLVATDDQDGTAYAFSLNNNYEIVNDNVQELYNPDSINSLFGFNLYNEAMRKLALTNESFLNIIAEHNILLKEISDVKQLIYTQQDINTIYKKISNLENLLKLYQSNQIVSTETIEVQFTSDSPPEILLNSVDKFYSKIENINISQLWSTSGAIPMNISVPKNKNFLLNITNNDSVQFILPNSEIPTIVLDRDLDYKQGVDIIIEASDGSTENKKLDIYIRHQAGNASNQAVETKLLDTLNLPVYYNTSTNSKNSAKNWDKFNFEIDIDQPFEIDPINKKMIVPISSTYSLVENSIKAGDTLQIKNFILGTYSQTDFSNQYLVDSIDIAQAKPYILLDISTDDDLISYIGSSLLQINDPSNYILSAFPYLDINKGYKYRITRILQDDEIDNTSSIPTILQMYKIIQI